MDGYTAISYLNFFYLFVRFLFFHNPVVINSLIHELSAWFPRIYQVIDRYKYTAIWLASTSSWKLASTWYPSTSSVIINENPGHTVLLGNFGKKCARSADFFARGARCLGPGSTYGHSIRKRGVVKRGQITISVWFLKVFFGVSGPPILEAFRFKCPSTWGNVIEKWEKMRKIYR